MDFLRDRVSLFAAVGCSVVFGMSGIYSYYKANRQISEHIGELTTTIEDLKREVQELRIASQMHSPVPLTPTTLRNNPQFHQVFPTLHDETLDGPIGINSTNSLHHAFFRRSSKNYESSNDDNEEFYDFAEV